MKYLKLKELHDNYNKHQFGKDMVCHGCWLATNEKKQTDFAYLLNMARYDLPYEELIQEYLPDWEAVILEKIKQQEQEVSFFATAFKEILETNPELKEILSHCKSEYLRFLFNSLLGICQDNLGKYEKLYQIRNGIITEETKWIFENIKLIEKELA